MDAHRLLVGFLVVSATGLGAGCFGPDEDPSTPVEDTETTPGDTVEAGVTPTEVTATPTMFETAGDLENATEEDDGETTTAEE